jgi:ABC-2 type transport system ATP-binding protein
MMSDDIAIHISGVSKDFVLDRDKENTIKGLIVNSWKRNKGHKVLNALSDVSFEVKKGEFFGIVGRNGSGKSTLLKLMAGIYSPTSGRITINGKLTPFIELGVGFNPELTGRENVYLNGALLGFNRKEMRAMYEDIVDFAELHKFMDQKLKNYSSGMQVRLAFSIAIKAQSDILVLDEVLAVGDAAFQQKCNSYFQSLKRKEQTIILVTHAMDNVNRYCDRAMLIGDGKVKLIGKPEDVANQYTLENLNAEKTSSKSKSKVVSNEDGSTRKLSEHVKRLDIVAQSPLLFTKPTQDEEFVFDVIYELTEDIPVDLGISVLYQNVSLIEHNTKKLKINHNKNTIYTLTYKVPLKNLNSGRFDVSAAIFQKKGFILIGFNTDSCSFIIDRGVKSGGGVIVSRGEWLINE